MYVKFPKGQVISKQSRYKNTGSYLRLSNYLKQEYIKEGKEVFYFDQESDNISNDEAVAIIDNNVKGLKAEERKFYHLVINPSKEELAFINSDKEVLKEFTRDVMSIYSDNYHFKNPISNNELVWVATIHDNRTYKSSDLDPYNPNIRVGDLKAGDNTHIHITVSARTKDMSQTLNPFTNRTKRFSITNFCRDSSYHFAHKYNYPETIRYYDDYMVQSQSRKLQNTLNRFNKSHNTFHTLDRIGSYIRTYGAEIVQSSINSISTTLKDDRYNYMVNIEVEKSRKSNSDMLSFSSLVNICKANEKDKVNRFDNFSILSRKNEIISFANRLASFTDKPLEMDKVMSLAKEYNYNSNFYKAMIQFRDLVPGDVNRHHLHKYLKHQLDIGSNDFGISVVNPLTKISSQRLHDDSLLESIRRRRKGRDLGYQI